MAHPYSCPMKGAKIIDEYFIENRTRLLDIAAFLDRLDRAADGDPSDGNGADFRVEALLRGIRELDGNGDRVRRIQMIFSDPTTEPRATLDTKSACGAYNHASKESE